MHRLIPTRLSKGCVVQFLLFTAFLFLLASPATAAEDQASIKSPDGILELQAGVLDGGVPFYRLMHNGQTLVKESRLGYSFKSRPAMTDSFSLVTSEKDSVNKSWEPLWGETSEIQNQYNQLTLTFRQNDRDKREMQIIFRLFDDGLGFRYLLPEQDNLGEFVISAEHTQFVLTEDYHAWWIPDDYDVYEWLYSSAPMSKIGEVLPEMQHTHDSGQASMDGANTPITLRSKAGLHLAIHEAALVDYAGMTLVHDKSARHALKSRLVPWPNGDKVVASTPMQSPWRVLLIEESAAELITNRVILNLNEPNVLDNTDFIQPMKYVGIWWSMHLGITSWGKEGGKHGATTEEAKRYIDFAAGNNIQGVLVEGWNTGWESWYQDDNFDFYTQYDDFDLKEVTEYAKAKGVELIGHHETGGQVKSYEKNLERAFKLYQDHGVRAVKTGYAGKIRPAGHYHHGQWMVRHYYKVMETAARFGIMLDVHEPIKPTGLRRTYPNLMTAEGVRGMEWNAWSTGNPPEHTATIPFTRLLAGPADYTPGIFDLGYVRYADQYAFWNAIGGLKTKGRMSSTLARQLALFVVLYSPLQMASDLVENYEAHPAFQFIRDVPVDWSQTLVPHAAVGEYVTIVRQDKASDDWYVGSITDRKARSLTLKLDFLDPKKTYTATIYRDDKDSHYQKNQVVFGIERHMVKAGDDIEMHLAPGGGQAIRIQAVNALHPIPGK